MIIACPICKVKRELNKLGAYNFKRGKYKGICRSCSGKTNKGKLRNSKPEYLLSGSIIFWNIRDPENCLRSLVECGKCKKSRYLHIDRRKRESFSGICQRCTRSNHTIQNNTPYWTGYIYSIYIYRHIDTFTSSEQNVLLEMVVKNKYILEHRAVMALALNRSLTKSEIVHHLNGIKTDNRLCNLELVTIKTHKTEDMKMFNRLRTEIKRLQDILEQHSINYTNPIFDLDKAHLG